MLCPGLCSHLPTACPKPLRHRLPTHNDLYCQAEEQTRDFLRHLLCKPALPGFPSCVLRRKHHLHVAAGEAGTFKTETEKREGEDGGQLEFPWCSPAASAACFLCNLFSLCPGKLPSSSLLSRSSHGHRDTLKMCVQISTRTSKIRLASTAQY